MDEKGHPSWLGSSVKLLENVAFGTKRLNAFVLKRVATNNPSAAMVVRFDHCRDGDRRKKRYQSNRDEKLYQ